jgi:hypothetical protein
MKSEGKSKTERLRSAAIVKMKYQMVTGKMDEGFRTVFKGVLKDLSLTESEVDGYIDQNKEELTRICVEKG